MKELVIENLLHVLFQTALCAACTHSDDTCQHTAIPTGIAEKTVKQVCDTGLQRVTKTYFCFTTKQWKIRTYVCIWSSYISLYDLHAVVVIISVITEVFLSNIFNIIFSNTEMFLEFPYSSGYIAVSIKRIHCCH